MKRTAIIYHKDCPDGAASALVAEQAFAEHSGLDGVEFIPMAYGDRPEWERFHGCVVWFVDFSWPRDALLALATVAEEVHVIDHHKTAKDALADIATFAPGRCPIHVTFDMTKCGAVLTFEAMTVGEEINPFFLYIQDRDLWQWKMPFSREVAATVSTFGRTHAGMRAAFGVWCLQTIGEFCWVGERVLALQRQTTDNLASTATLQNFHGYNIPVCNVPQETGLQSEVGEALCAKYPDAPFAMEQGHVDGWDDARMPTVRSSTAGSSPSSSPAAAGTLAPPDSRPPRAWPPRDAQDPPGSGPRPPHRPHQGQARRRRLPYRVPMVHTGTRVRPTTDRHHRRHPTSKETASCLSITCSLSKDRTASARPPSRSSSSPN